MSRNIIRAGVVAVGVTCCGVLAPTSMAVADPRGGVFELACGQQTFSIVTTSGRGDFTPAFDTASNKVFVPVSFGAFSGAIYQINSDETETLFSEFTDPATTVKGSGKQRATTPCTYSFTDSFTVSEADAAEGDPDDPEYLPAGTYRFEGSGSVVGQITGR